MHGDDRDRGRVLRLVGSVLAVLFRRRRSECSTDERVLVPNARLFLIQLMPPVMIEELLVADHFLLSGYAVRRLAG